jgi:lupus La protein
MATEAAAAAATPAPAVSLDETKAKNVLRQVRCSHDPSQPCNLRDRGCLSIPLSSFRVPQVEFYFSDSNLPRDGFLRKTVEESEDGCTNPSQSPIDHADLL